VVVRRCCIDRVGQEYRLREEEPIAEEELPAEEWVEERIAKTSVPEKDVEAQVVAEDDWSNKRSPMNKRAWAQHTEPTLGRLHSTNTRTDADAYGTTWALYCPQLPFKA